MSVNFLVALEVGGGGVRFLQAARAEDADVGSAWCVPRDRALGRGAQARELRLRGFQCLPFKSKPWAAVCQRTQRCYQVSASLHTLINSPHPYHPNQQWGSCWTCKIKLH